MDKEHFVFLDPFELIFITKSCILFYHNDNNRTHYNY